MQTFKEKILNQVSKYPSTRYMGSKEKLIEPLFETFASLKFNSAIDIMSGTGVISYLLKAMGKKVISNDYMHMNYMYGLAMISNNTIKVDDKLANKLIKENRKSDYILKTFKGLYYDDDDYLMISNIRNNISQLKNNTSKYISISALIRACIKKRPRGIFAYTGLRYNDGRKDLKKTINEHFLENIQTINGAIFSNGMKNQSLNLDCMNMENYAHLVYIDPPYFSKLSDNEYVRRYHFVEGLSRNWENITLQEHTKTKKFKSYPSPFTKLETTIQAFDALFNKYRKSHIVLSYSSNSLPNKDVILKLLKKYKSSVVLNEIDYRYSFSNQNFAKDRIKNDVREYIFIGTS